MTIFPFILDSRGPWQGPGESLLLLPYAAHTLLAEICTQLARRTDNPATVVAPFEPDERYSRSIRGAGAGVETIVPAATFDKALASYEPSDWILFIDPRRYPTGGLDLGGFFVGQLDTHPAHHLIALDLSEQGTKEYLQFDAAGQVRRIQRYYEGVTWQQASSVFASMASVACLRMLKQSPLDSLPEARNTLVACGVPSRDVLLAGGTMDLHDPRCVLKLVEQSIVRLSRRAAPASYRSLGEQSWASRTSRVAAAARLHGPVIVQDDAVVESGATVIGPAILGTGSTVGPGATVAQCLLVAGAAVPPDAAIHHKVVSPESADAAGGNGSPTRDKTPVIPAVGWVPPPHHLRAAHPHRAAALVKQVLDRVFATLGLILLSPLLLVTAALVRLDSKGPVLFGHEREGKDGRVFRCWKFRTMIQGAHARQRALYAKSGVDGPQFKIDHDPRITRMGRILRMTNIDELPQLFNVWLGQMSLIGPRPSPFRENQICIPWRQARLSVRPGITGLWQICRSNRSSGDFHQWIYYDMLYVRHMSLWLDLKILAATLITFGGRWGMPVTWMIPARKLYNETRPWIVPAIENA